MMDYTTGGCVMLTSKKLIAAALVSGGLLSLLVATPASAASSYCQIYNWSCVTDSVAANSSNSVRYRVNSGGVRCYYTVRDVVNGVPVRSGSTTSAVAWTTIGGLYSRYRLELSSGREEARLCYGFIAS